MAVFYRGLDVPSTTILERMRKFKRTVLRRPGARSSCSAAGAALATKQATLCYNESMRRSQHADPGQGPAATSRQRFVAFLLASATALLTAAPSLQEALWPLAWVALVPLFLAL